MTSLRLGSATRPRRRHVPRQSCVLVIALGACLAACGDARYGTSGVPDYLRGFYTTAEAKLPVVDITYIYPVAEYDRVKVGSSNALRREFKSVETKEYDSKQYDLKTDTILFETKTEHKKHCTCFVMKRSGRISVTTVTVNCEVLSYWTKWNKPPTHAPFEFISWRNDWYYDMQATLVESIKLQEALRQDLGYEGLEVGRADGALLDDKAIEGAVLNPTPPWCVKKGAAEQFTECRTAQQPHK